jgi:hypothetical protein
MRHTLRVVLYYGQGFLFGFVACVVVINAPKLSLFAAVLGLTGAFFSFMMGQNEATRKYSKHDKEDE